jgi:hypothetical protein
VQDLKLPSWAEICPFFAWLEQQALYLKQWSPPFRQLGHWNAKLLAVFGYCASANT